MIRGPYSGNHQIIIEGRTYDALLRSLLQTTLMCPRRMPGSDSSGLAQLELVKKTQTQPFSITKLKARTISSMGTNQVSTVYTLWAGVQTLTTRIRSVGEDNVHVVELQTLQRLFGPLDDAGHTRAIIQNTPQGWLNPTITVFLRDRCRSVPYEYRRRSL